MITNIHTATNSKSIVSLVEHSHC